jgi:hypothetical protein
VGYEACLKALELCNVVATVQLAEALRFDECLGGGEPQRCLDECLENCREGGCADLCLDALGVAAAKGAARRLIHWAVEVAPKTGLTIPEAAAVGFYMLLDALSSDCPAKANLMTVMGLAAVELGNLLGMRKMILLMAPAIARAYECIGDDAFNILDVAAPAIGRSKAKRVAAALDEGVVKIRRVMLTFPPARPA